MCGGAFDGGFVWGFVGVCDGDGFEEFFVLFGFIGMVGGGEEVDFSGVSLICDEEPVVGDGGELWIPGGEDDVVFTYAAEEGGDELVDDVDADGYEGDEEDGEEVGGWISG